MNYLDLRLRFAPEVRHPIHQFIDSSAAVDRDVLVHGNTLGDEDTFLFYVVGDREPYAAALAAAEGVVDFEITRIDDRSFYTFLRQRRPEVDEATFGAFQRTGVIVVPPIQFLPDGVATLTVVGESDALQSALEALPPAVEVTVERVGDYDWRQSLFDPGLTARQREAVRAAVDAGYYAVPREGGVEAVAEALECSSSTAAEHLRKAEAAVMGAFCRLRAYD
ncbi:MAG: helix-turn-helix domain-containing protein [Halohasta sp.]